MNQIELREISDGGSLSYRWPQLEEHFSQSWNGLIVAGSRGGRLTHALSEREVYGRRRAHTVTFVDDQPLVEGVAADDFERSQSLLTLIKPWMGHSLAKQPSDLSAPYREFEIVDHRAEIDAPYSKRCLAAKIRVDDLESWARAAWLRKIARGE